MKLCEIPQREVSPLDTELSVRIDILMADLANEVLAIHNTNSYCEQQA